MSSRSDIVTGMQNLITEETRRALFNAAYRQGVALGRKFEAQDMTIELRQAALQYAATYQGDFPYMVEMASQTLSGGLTDGQSKGVLNCLMADAKRRLASRAPRATSESASQAPQHQYLTSVPDGRYRVTLVDGEHLAVRIEKVSKDSSLPQGTRVISTRIGEDWLGRAAITPDGEFRLWKSAQGELRDRLSNAVEILDSSEAKDGWLIAGLAFAQAGSQCFFCGRDLDTPESLLVGYGPTCADKHGLPWGDKATPAAVLLARAEAEKAGEVASPAPEAEATVQASSTEVKEVTVTQKSNHLTSPVSLAEAHARGKARSYSEIFGEE